MTPRAISAHELVRTRDCEERGCEDDGTLREDLRVLCDRHAAAARTANGAAREAAANGAVVAPVF